MSKKRGTNVPANYQALAASGQRVRYNGFWLGDSERDRVIARYIDQTPQVGAILKAILYSIATGQGCLPAPQTKPQAEQDNYSDEIGEAGSALLELDD